MPIEVYTIGYAHLKPDSFIKILKDIGIEVLIDIRRWPTSKIDQFRKEKLESLLKEEGIDYVWMGDTLGGYREGGYQEYMHTESFKKGLDELTKIASRKRACIMCLESKPSACHRRFISEKLLDLGFNVLHILPGGKIVKMSSNR